MRLSKLLAFLKFRFDLGSIFLTLANFVMLVIMISGQVVTYFDITINHGQLIFASIAIPLGFLTVLVLGEILIRIKYFESYMTENNNRNPIYEELLKEIRSIKK